jgi:hypothetical protein
LEGVVGEVFHGIDTHAGEGGDGGMVEVEELVPDGKLVCVLAPQGQSGRGIFYSFATHSLYDTLIMAAGKESNCVDNPSAIEGGKP